MSNSKSTTLRRWIKKLKSLGRRPQGDDQLAPIASASREFEHEQLPEVPAVSDELSKDLDLSDITFDESELDTSGLTFESSEATIVSQTIVYSIEEKKAEKAKVWAIRQRAHDATFNGTDISHEVALLKNQWLDDSSVQQTFGAQSGSSKRYQLVLSTSATRARSHPRHMPDTALRYSLNPNLAMDFDTIAEVIRQSGPSGPARTQMVFSMMRQAFHLQYNAAQSHVDKKIQAALQRQREELEADFDTARRFAEQTHRIDIENLKDDHESAIMDLEERLEEARSEATTSKSQSDTAHEQQLANMREQVKVAQEEKESVLQQLLQQIEAVESHRDWVQRLQEERDMLEQRLAMMEQGQNQATLPGPHSSLQSLQQQQGVHSAMAESLKGLADRNRTLENENVRLGRCLETLAETKLRDFSYLIKDRKCLWALAPEGIETVEKDLAYTQGLRENELQRYADAEKAWSEELATARFQAKAKGQEISGLKGDLACAERDTRDLGMDRDYWTNQYTELLSLVQSGEEGTERLRESTLSDIRERLVTSAEALSQLQKEFEQQKDDMLNKIDDRDAEINMLHQKLADAVRKVDSANLQAEINQVDIDEHMPNLQKQVDRLEAILAEKDFGHGDRLSTVCQHLQARYAHMKMERDSYKGQALQAIINLSVSQMDHAMFVGSIRYDMESAATYIAERDGLRAENTALKERFEQELMVRPLCVPTRERTEEDLLEEAQLKAKVERQFGITYGTVPRFNMDKGLEEYEALKDECRAWQRENDFRFG